jgi:hypothetical protein
MQQLSANVGCDAGFGHTEFAASESEFRVGAEAAQVL